MRASRDVILAAIILVIPCSTGHIPSVLAVPPKAQAVSVDRPLHQAVLRATESGRLNPGFSKSAQGFDAFGVTLLGHVPLDAFAGNPNSGNDVWGYVSPSGREYAIMGLNPGTGFVEVTDPQHPFIVATIPDSASTWSDMAVYDQYAYNVNENSGGLQVIDLTQIDQGIVTVATSATQFQTAHNVFVNPDSGFAYPCGTNVFGAWGFIAYDLSDPANPQTNPAWIWGDSYAHDLQVVSYADCPYSGREGECEIAFVFGGGSGFWIVDVTDKFNMTTISTIGYPDLSYCHQGWLTEDRQHACIGDEADELSHGLSTRTIVVDVQDLANPQYVTSFTNGNPAIDHNLMVRGNYVYEANYSSGLRIYDISDINNVQEVGYFDTFPSDDRVDYVGAWGVYAGLPSGSILIGDMQSGLFVFDVSEAVGCLSDAACDDDDPCTTDTCLGTGDCDHTQLSVGAACDDGNTCTINGECDVNGLCISVDVNTIACTDDPPCVPGTCNTDTGFCECVPCSPSEPACDEAGCIDPVVVPKNRYFSIIAGEPGRPQAIKVVFTSVPGFEYAEGRTKWVQEPTPVTEASGSAEATPPPTYLTADLGCTPYFTDWSAHGRIDVYDDAIVPGAAFQVRVIGAGCDRSEARNYSAALPMVMSLVGDVAGDCGVTPCTAPQGIVDFVDISAVVEKFRNLPDAPRKARTDLTNSDVTNPRPDRKVDFVDISYCVEAFRNLAAPLPGPPVVDPCP